MFVHIYEYSQDWYAAKMNMHLVFIKNSKLDSGIKKNVEKYSRVI